MYESFFGFRRRPFAPLPDPSLFYPSPSHRQAVRLVASPLHTPGGWLLVTGESGIGKTTVARHLMEQMQAARISLIPARTLIGQLAQPSGFASGSTGPVTEPTRVQGALGAAFATPSPKEQPGLLIIDDAQYLDRAGLALLVGLDPEANLRLLLLGRPELGERLRQAGYEQIRKRIVLFYQLNRLDLDETTRYIQYRLKQTGGPLDLFTAAAFQSIFEYSQGLPRLINLVCERALVAAYTAKAGSIDAWLIDQAMYEPLPDHLAAEADSTLVLEQSDRREPRPSNPRVSQADRQISPTQSPESPLAPQTLLEMPSAKRPHPEETPIPRLKPTGFRPRAPRAHQVIRPTQRTPVQARRQSAPVLTAALIALAGLSGWSLHAAWTWMRGRDQTAPELQSIPESIADTATGLESGPMPAAMPPPEPETEHPVFEDLIGLAQEPSGSEPQTAPSQIELGALDIREPAPALAALAERLTSLGIAYEWRGPAHLRADLSKKIRFREGSVALDGPARAFLAQFAEWIREAGDLSLHVRAHTDSRGTQPNNQRLSQRRAADVAFILRLNGIPNSRITYEGKGSSEPRFSPEEERRLGPEINRRIEIDLIAPADQR